MVFFRNWHIAQKFSAGISSNFLHSIRASICIRNVIKLGVISEPFFGKKPWANTGYFSEIGIIFKNCHNSKNLSPNQLKLSTLHKDINMYQKCNKNWG